MEDMDENCSRELTGKHFDIIYESLVRVIALYFMLSVIFFLLSGDKNPDLKTKFDRETLSYSHDRLQELDPVAANRIHPNDHRKVRHISYYLVILLMI